MSLDILDIGPLTEAAAIEWLNRRLAAVDEVGWSSSQAADLLRDVFDAVVRPVVSVLGIRGDRARQAEATGWAAAWEALRRPSLRETYSPWGVLWVAVRRAVLRERLGDDFLAGGRTAWQFRESVQRTWDHADRVRRPVSWDLLADSGWEPVSRQSAAMAPSRLLDLLADAFAEAGWEPAVAHRLVRQIAATAPPLAKRTQAVSGWRSLAVELGIEPWRARRATVAVLGLPGRPGLAERVVRHGPGELRCDESRRALEATVHYGRRVSAAA